MNPQDEPLAEWEKELLREQSIRSASHPEWSVHLWVECDVDPFGEETPHLLGYLGERLARFHAAISPRDGGVTVQAYCRAKSNAGAVNEVTDAALFHMRDVGLLPPPNMRVSVRPWAEFAAEQDRPAAVHVFTYGQHASWCSDGSYCGGPHCPPITATDVFVPDCRNPECNCANAPRVSKAACSNCPDCWCGVTK